MYSDWKNSVIWKASFWKSGERQLGNGLLFDCSFEKLTNNKLFMEVVMEGFHDSHVGGLAETMKQFCMKIDLISQGYCFCPSTWRQWRHMKMLYNDRKAVLKWHPPHTHTHAHTGAFVFHNSSSCRMVGRSDGPHNRQVLLYAGTSILNTMCSIEEVNSLSSYSASKRDGKAVMPLIVEAVKLINKLGKINITWL